MNIRSNWRIITLSILLVLSVIILSPIGSASTSNPDSLDLNLSYGLDLSGGTRLRAPIVGWTAEEVSFIGYQESNIEETMVGLRQFGSGQKGLISVGLLSSVARNLLPEASEKLSKKFPDIELDILEISPAEAIDLLYGRQLSVAVLAEDSIAKSILSFSKTHLFEDPYVLAVPKSISLENIQNLDELKNSAESKVLSNIIQFEFGNQHKRRIEEWFTSVLPNSRVFAKTRTYEVALSMVQSGRGVAVVPALAARLGGKKLDFDVNLYKTNLPVRKIISLIPSQYVRIEPYKSFIEALLYTGKNIQLPKINKVPPILESLSL